MIGSNLSESPSMKDKSLFFANFSMNLLHNFLQKKKTVWNDKHVFVSPKWKQSKTIIFETKSHRFFFYNVILRHIQTHWWYIFLCDIEKYTYFKYLHTQTTISGIDKKLFAFTFDWNILYMYLFLGVSVTFCLVECVKKINIYKLN